MPNHMSQDRSVSVTKEEILSHAQRILAAVSTSPINKVLELYQYRAIHTVEFKDDGKHQDNWVVTCHIGYNGEVIDAIFTGRDASKKAAKKLAAESALEHINKHLHEANTLVLHETLQPVNVPTEPTKNQLLKVDEFKIHHDLLRKLAKLEKGSMPKIGLLSIDLEQYDQDNDIPLEVGIDFVLLDTPTEHQAHHLVVSENYELRNGKYVDDHKDDFLFGESLKVSDSKLGEHVENLVKSFEMQCDQLIVVGHTIESDVKWLAGMGIMFADGIEVLDIAKAHVYVMHEGKFASIDGMGKIMAHYGLSYACAHNGGNDAVYNLQLLEKMLIRERNHS